MNLPIFSQTATNAKKTHFKINFFIMVAKKLPKFSLDFGELFLHFMILLWAFTYVKKAHA